jgi:hypothetical protein
MNTANAAQPAMRRAIPLAILILTLLPAWAMAQAGPPPVGGQDPYYRHYQHEHPRHRQAHWYAGESMRQNEEARQMMCGFSGQRWALDWDMHYRWALRVNPNRVYREIEERDRHLARCRSNKLREHRRRPPPGRPY